MEVGRDLTPGPTERVEGFEPPAFWFVAKISSAELHPHGASPGSEYRQIVVHFKTNLTVPPSRIELLSLGLHSIIIPLYESGMVRLSLSENSSILGYAGLLLQPTLHVQSSTS